MVRPPPCSSASGCGHRASSLTKRRKRLAQPTQRTTTQGRGSRTMPLVASFRRITCKSIPSLRAAAVASAGVLTQRSTDGKRCAVEITPEQDALIAPSLPVHRGNVGSSKRHVRNAFVSVVAHGGKWRGLPQSFANWHTIATRINRCSKANVCDRIVAKRQQAAILRLRIAEVSHDSTHRKVHPDSSGVLKKWQTIAWTV